MKMAVYHGIRDLRIEEVEEPKPGLKEVKIKVKYCGICGSDLHEYLHGLFPQSPFGHEACGEIVEVGPEVAGFQPGDRVIAFEKGAYAEYLVCPQERLMKIPRDMTWERAAVVEPLAGAAYAIERAGIKASDTILIAGAGTGGSHDFAGPQSHWREKDICDGGLRKQKEKSRRIGRQCCPESNGSQNPGPGQRAHGWRRSRCGRRSGRNRSHSQGLPRFRPLPGESPCSRNLYGANTGSHARVRDPGNHHDRRELHQSFLGHELDRIEGDQARVDYYKIIPLKQITASGFEVLSRKTKEEIKILVEP